MNRSNNTIEPLFTCVIPTYLRIKLIRKLLESLSKAKENIGKPIEIIIVDDTPSPEDKEVNDLCDIYKARYLRGTSSVREKRNLGITNANGEYVLFIDSDCEASGELFIEHYKTLSSSTYEACVGVTKFVGKDSLMWQIISHTKFTDSFNFPVLLQDKVESAPWGPTTNLSVRKDVLKQIGGFETQLPFKLGADDADLGLRINASGYRIGMNSNAIVYHSKETWNNLSSIVKRVFRWGRMDYYLYYKRHIKQTFVTLPKPIFCFYMIITFNLLLAFRFSLVYLSLVLIWLFSYFLLLALITKRHLKSNTRVIVLASSEILNFLFDFGCSIESLKHGSFSFLYREPIDDPRNLWWKKIHESWAASITTFFNLVLFIIWSAFQLMF